MVIPTMQHGDGFEQRIRHPGHTLHRIHRLANAFHRDSGCRKIAQFSQLH